MLHASLANQPDVAFRWVIGRAPHRTAQFAVEHGIPHHSTELAEALDDDKVDAVVICTPNEYHYGQALQSLQAGKHVIVEVPMCMDYHAAETLVSVAAERNRYLSVPHITRYTSAAMEAKRLLASGQVGQVLQIIYRRLWYQRRIGRWLRRERSWVDTVSWHHAAHAVDLAIWLLSEPMQCVGAIVRRDRELLNPVDLSANFTAASGAIVTLALSYNAQREIFDCVIVGSKSLLEMQGFSLLQLNGDTIVDDPDPISNPQKAYHRYATAVVAGLRGQSPTPVSGAEILPMMAQLQRLNELASRSSARVQIAS